MPWIRMLEGARTPEDVVQVARKFVAQLSDSEIELLPRDCRPPQLASPEDVRQYALRLVKQPARGPNARIALRISEFVSAAAIRIAKLQRKEKKPA